MNRRESVLRRIGCGYIDGERSFTQLGISTDLGVSLSVSNGVVGSLRDINAIRVGRRSFEVIALDRLLLYWATHRNLKRDMVYRARADAGIREIERSMPEGIAFTGYTAYRLLFGEAPADYSETYLYATDEALGVIKARFKPSDRVPNITVLRCDSELEDSIRRHRLKRSSVCAGQLFADLWNMGEWYAKDFVAALEKRLGI